MIHVDRTRVTAPAFLKSPKVKAAKERLEKFFQDPLETRRQRIPPFDRSIYSAPEVREALRTLFQNKCAYCETPIPETGPADVDQFRPKARVLGIDGTVDQDGYWWLAYEWENLYYTCGNCNRLKGSRFPVSGARATRGTDLNAEQRLLLDPCRDRPDEHLVFSQDGTAASSTAEGRATIDVLGLNRVDLVKNRRDILVTLRADYKGLVGKSAKSGLVSARILTLADPAQPYAAARVQLLQTWLKEEKRAAPSGIGSGPFTSDPERKAAIAEFQKAEQVQEAYSVADEHAKPHYYARTRLIDRIEIQNFRAIQDLTLRFPEPAVAAQSRPNVEGSPPASWLMLLGENGSGKSSVLQAVAVALIGEKWRHRLQLDARHFLRKGTSTGFVRLFLTGLNAPIQLRFSNDSAAFESEPKEPKVLLLGYGSTRLLPRAPVASTQQFDFARIDNLFNPFEPLNDAATWLASLDPGRFETVARALRAILQLGPEDRLVQVNGHVEAEIFGTRVTLDDLSDGYQSVVALATDIMRVMLNRWDAMEIAEGVVVLDEIGSHLHPRWRMRIVDALRQTLPRVQFLVSTHDPLCLRGLTSGEVAVMRRDAANRIVALIDLPTIAGLRVDQLLTSEYFGLSSTIDPELDSLFSEYYKLLALRRPSQPQKTRLAQLKAELAQYQVLGSNQRERLMLEAIDQYMADDKASATPGNIQLKAATKTRLARIWATTPAAPGRRGTRA